MKPDCIGKFALVAAVLLPAGSLSLARVATTASSVPGDATSSDVFVGTSPCEAALKEMLAIPGSTPCELAKWKLVLHREPDTGAPTTFDLVCDHGLPKQGSNGLAAGAGRAQREGSWRVVRGTRTDPDALVYQLDADGTEPVSFQAVGTELLHLLDGAGSPMVGNAGWSYTLNRTAAVGQSRQAERNAQPAARSGFAPAGDAPPTLAESAFVGRSPGFDAEEHPKLKWDLTLYRDPQTLVPTTFRIAGTLYRGAELEGSWRITRGAAVDADAQVYELEAHDGRTTLLLLRLDGDVLLFLDRDRELLVGNGDFSFTLNRAEVRSSER